MASSPPPLQSNLSYCNLKDAESDSSNPEAVKYQQEILSHNALDAVFESPPKVRPALPTALKEFLVSVQSWSDAKGHTEYTITTSMSGSAAAWVTTSRRFSDFILLHSRICTPLGLRREFPVPKTPFVTDGVKRFRLRALQGYLRHACAAAVARAGPSTSDGTLGSELPMALSEFLGLEVLTKTIAEAAEAAAIAAAADVPSAPDTPAPTAAPMDQADSPDTIMASPVSATPVSRMDHSESCSPATLAAKAMVAQIQIAGAQMGSTRAQLAVSGVALAFLVMCFFRVSQTA